MMWHELQKLGCPVTTIEPAEKTATAISTSNNFARQLNCLNTFITDLNMALIYLIIPLFDLANSPVYSLDRKRYRCNIRYELRFFVTTKT
jgi:hypothetical protein